MGIRIYKYATRSTIVDISSALNYYKINKYNEKEYKGSIQFLIHQYTKEKQARAFLPKATTKMIMDSIIKHQFHKLFPEGFSQYGGSAQKGIARILSISFDKEQLKYVLKIDEGAGKVGHNGAIMMVSKEKNAVAYIPYDEMLKMAHEIIDFIKQAEIISMLNGKPLYTILPVHQYQNQ